MTNIIKLLASPNGYAPDPKGVMSILTATVTDRLSGEPVAGVPVTFSTTTPYVTFSVLSGITDAKGELKSNLTYPDPNPGNQLSGIALITVVATDDNDASGQVLINFWDPDLAYPRILNADTDSVTGLTEIPYSTVEYGLQVLIYLPANLAIGTLVTFFWDSQFVQMIYTGGPLVWVIPVYTYFIPEQALSPGLHLIWYMLEDVVGNRTGSFRLYGRITASPYEAPVLLPPLFPPALNGAINLAAAEAGVSFTLPLLAQPEVNSNYLYRAYMRVVNPQGPQPEPVRLVQNFVPNPKSDVTVSVPLNNLTGLNGVWVNFYYTISPTPTITHLSQSKRMYVDTVPPGETL